MGMGATNSSDRIAARFGFINGVDTAFAPGKDIPHGGVLFALPALLSCGLLTNVTSHFFLPSGYYTLYHYFLLLAFMTLCRIKSFEGLRYQPPGEWGKLLGLDRIPEVKTVREKVKILSDKGQVAAWSSKLCDMWMDEESDLLGVLYIDGHVRVYHGHQTKLPRHYVARQRLCIRATVDYWIHTIDGNPFFRITKPIDPGLLQVLKNDIIENVVSRHSALHDHRLTIVVDREGYSPGFFKEMKEKYSIAVITYNKYPKKDWSENEFSKHLIELHGGTVEEMLLAERGTRLSNGLWVREVRKLSENNHQTSILSTDYESDFMVIASRIFRRWSQENFFKYMREHFSLDRMITYDTECVSDTQKMVNPDYRKLDGQIRSKCGILNRKMAKFCELSLKEDIEPKNVEKFIAQKADLHQQIQDLQGDIVLLKKQRKDTKRHIPVGELPQDHKFKQLHAKSKDFIDTIKMISYRAETAMATVVREKLSRKNDARSFLRSIYATEADILPLENEKVLQVRIHNLANQCENDALQYLCDELNETKTIFPGTDLTMVFSIL